MRTAGIKRRAQKKITEMYALVQALRAVNTPKLVTEDATLFNSLIEDLFPQQPQGISSNLPTLLLYLSYPRRKEQISRCEGCSRGEIKGREPH